MGNIRKTITLTDQQDRWIKAQATAGNFSDDGEYIRELIRRDQEQHQIPGSQDRDSGGDGQRGE